MPASPPFPKHPQLPPTNCTTPLRDCKSKNFHGAKRVTQLLKFPGTVSVLNCSAPLAGGDICLGLKTLKFSPPTLLVLATRARNLFVVWFLLGGFSAVLNCRVWKEFGRR